MIAHAETCRCEACVERIADDIENGVYVAEPLRVVSDVPTLDHFQPEPLEWLWSRYMPAGKLVMLDGDPGQGKSLIALSLIASVTTGKKLPDGSLPLKTGGAVLLGAEDGLQDTIIPRLMAVGADLSRIKVPHAVDYGVPLELPRDTDRLTRYMREVGAVLVVLDPLEHYVDADIIKGRDQRQALTPLLRVLADTGALLIGTRHLNQREGQKGMYRGRGDITALGVARVGYLIGDDPEEDGSHVMARTKGNLSKDPGSLRYKILGATLEATGSEVAYVEWSGQSMSSADQVAGSDVAKTSTAQQIIAREILPHLQDGPMLTKDAESILHGFNIRSADTINRAKRKLMIVSKKEGSGPWWWLLPGQQIPQE